MTASNYSAFGLAIAVLGCGATVFVAEVTDFPFAYIWAAFFGYKTVEFGRWSDERRRGER